MNNFLKLFIFFSVFPAIKLFGISITLFIFLIFIIRLKNVRLELLKSKGFVFFGLVLLISSLISFNIQEVYHPGRFYIIKIVLQYFYWISVALFFKSYFSVLNFKSLGKFFFLGLICLIFSFFVYKIEFEIGPLSVNTQVTRNNFVFILLASFPFCYYYLINNQNLKKISMACYTRSFFACFFSEGRSGVLFYS